MAGLTLSGSDVPASAAKRVRRTKSRGRKGLQLEVGVQRAPRLLVYYNDDKEDDENRLGLRIMQCVATLWNAGRASGPQASDYHDDDDVDNHRNHHHDVDHPHHNHQDLDLRPTIMMMMLI